MSVITTVSRRSRRDLVHFRQQKHTKTKSEKKATVAAIPAPMARTWLGGITLPVGANVGLLLGCTVGDGVSNVGYGVVGKRLGENVGL